MLEHSESLVVKHSTQQDYYKKYCCEEYTLISPWPALLCKLQTKSSAVSSVHFWSAGQADTTVDCRVYCTHSPKGNKHEKK